MAARLWRLFWLTVLVGHALLAVLWWWPQPGGFGIGHPRSWSNQVGPIAVLALSIASLWVIHRGQSGMVRLLLPIWPAAWAAAALGGRFLFPISLAWLWLVPAGGAAVMGLGAIPSWRNSPRGSRGICAGLAFGSALGGARLAWAQRVPPPATHPVNWSLPVLDTSTSSPIVQAGAVRLEGKVLVHSFDGSITAPVSRLMLMIEPLLTFSSWSPDGCPTVLVGREERAGPAPRLREGCRDGKRSCGFVYDFRGQGSASLIVGARPDVKGVAIEAVSMLDRPVYSQRIPACWARRPNREPFISDRSRRAESPSKACLRFVPDRRPPAGSSLS